jgi:hypothetical protein
MASLIDTPHASEEEVMQNLAKIADPNDAIHVRLAKTLPINAGERLRDVQQSMSLGIQRICADLQSTMIKIATSPGRHHTGLGGMQVRTESSMTHVFLMRMDPRHELYHDQYSMRSQ